MSALRLFISYSHTDEKLIENFETHLRVLEDLEQITIWRDRKNQVGDEFLKNIDDNLYCSDIICLCISAKFLVSPACKKELEESFKLKREKQVRVIPIILSHCGWTDIPNLSKHLATPTDGSPISSFDDEDAGWSVVCADIKKVVEYENEIKKLQFVQSFSEELNDSGIFKKAHPKKESLLLSDIYIFPELKYYNMENGKEDKVNGELIVNNIIDEKRVIIRGVSQSGKTALAKMLCIKLLAKKLIPIFIDIKSSPFNKKKMEELFTKQYEGMAFHKIDPSRFIPVIDNFDSVKNRGKILSDLEGYKSCLLVMDVDTELNIKSKNLFLDYIDYEIKEYAPSLRDSLIRKWLEIDSSSNDNDSKFYADLDSKTSLITEALGKISGKGIVPSFPFYIISILSSYETLNHPLDQEITSQGYCYQALILYYLKKQNVRNDDIDYYINFMSEFAYFLFKQKQKEVSAVTFNNFFSEYKERFNIPHKFLDILLNSHLVYQTSLSNYTFTYPYIYYFFCGKYFSENATNKNIEAEIHDILNKLHVNDNAYIIIFVSHHARNSNLLDDIQLQSMYLFNGYNAATLERESLMCFEAQDNLIEQITIPEKNQCEEERAYQLKQKDLMENSENSDVIDNHEMETDELEDDSFRRTFKTVEVLGHIIKNRAGSIEKNKLEEMFVEGMNTFLRLISVHLEAITKKENEEDLVNLISHYIDKIQNEKNNPLSEEEVYKKAKKIFWQINFVFVYIYISQIVHLLGSEKLSDIISTACDRINTPATHIVKFIVQLWYNKSITPDDVKKVMHKNKLSYVPIKILNIHVRNYALIHPINTKDRNKLRELFQEPIPYKKN